MANPRHSGKESHRPRNPNNRTSGPAPTGTATGAPNRTPWSASATTHLATGSSSAASASGTGRDRPAGLGDIPPGARRSPRPPGRPSPARPAAVQPPAPTPAARPPTRRARRTRAYGSRRRGSTSSPEFICPHPARPHPPQRPSVAPQAPPTALRAPRAAESARGSPAPSDTCRGRSGLDPPRHRHSLRHGYGSRIRITDTDHGRRCRPARRRKQIGRSRGQPGTGPQHTRVLRDRLPSSASRPRCSTAAAASPISGRRA